MTAVVAILVVCGLAGPAAAAEADDYLLHCAGCHRLDASGSATVPALDEIGILFTVPGGREYLGSVPGAAQAPLSDERLARLLNWILPRFGHTPARPPYTAAEVKHLRAKPLRDPIGARARLLAPEDSD